MVLSIILVQYGPYEKLFHLLESIQHNLSLKEAEYEVIIVDNNASRPQNRKLQSFTHIKYLKSKGNLGYAAGNNLGSKLAKGEYLLILNPDTLVLKSSIENLIKYIKSNKKTAIVSPLLLDNNLQSYKQLGITTLNPVTGIFVLSFINKYWNTNPISTRYWGNYRDWTKPLLVDMVPGSAILIRKAIYKKLGGFDENFFLFFEEVDLCKRVKKLGYEIVILPTSKVIHFWGAKQKGSDKLKKIYLQSRYYYFKKHYGVVAAKLVELFCNLSIKKFMNGQQPVS